MLLLKRGDVNPVTQNLKNVTGFEENISISG